MLKKLSLTCFIAIIPYLSIILTQPDQQNTDDIADSICLFGIDANGLCRPPSRFTVTTTTTRKLTSKALMPTTPKSNAPKTSSTTSSTRTTTTTATSRPTTTSHIRPTTTTTKTTKIIISSTTKSTIKPTTALTTTFEKTTKTSTATTRTTLTISTTTRITTTTKNTNLRSTTTPTRQERTTAKSFTTHQSRFVSNDLLNEDLEVFTTTNLPDDLDNSNFITLPLIKKGSQLSDVKRRTQALPKSANLPDEPNFGNQLTDAFSSTTLSPTNVLDKKRKLVDNVEPKDVEDGVTLPAMTNILTNVENTNDMTQKNANTGKITDTVVGNLEQTSTTRGMFTQPTSKTQTSLTTWVSSKPINVFVSTRQNAKLSGNKDDDLQMDALPDLSPSVATQVIVKSPQVPTSKSTVANEEETPQTDDEDITTTPESSNEARPRQLDFGPHFRGHKNFVLVNERTNLRRPPWKGKERHHSDDRRRNRINTMVNNHNRNIHRHF